MRTSDAILNTVGDSPLTELMELDEFYCWTKRIAMLDSIFKPKKRSKVPYIIMGFAALIALGAIGAGIYLHYFY